jgi:PIN domain nuclease of toxin-antitoxin system
VSYVLDASAALAVLNAEAGADRVAQCLTEAVMSAINAVEVGSRLVDAGLATADALRAIELLRVPTIAFTEDLARIAIALRPATRAYGLSLADRACLALAIRDGATALTADRAWAKLDVGCRIELIR